ncbi:hypothetical protein D9M71_147840 [compost metagenome]
MALVEGVLQALEVRPAVVVGHHQLAVEPGLVERQPGQRPGLARQAAGPVVAVAGQQANFAVVDAGEDAIAVELDLVAPVAGRRRVQQGRQLRRKLLGQPALPFMGLAGLMGLAGRTWVFARLRGQRPAADHALRLLGQHVMLRKVPRQGVAALDQEPLRLAPAQLGAHQAPAAAELLAMQFELQVPFRQSFLGIALGRPVAVVPDDHVAGAVVSFRDMPFEVGVVQRMILHLDRQAPDAGVETRPLGHRPALQRAAQFQAEVVVQVAGVVLLDHEGERFLPPPAAPRTGLGSAAEVALARVFVEFRCAGHGVLLGGPHLLRSTGRPDDDSIGFPAGESSRAQSSRTMSISSIARRCTLLSFCSSAALMPTKVVMGIPWLRLLSMIE